MVIRHYIKTYFDKAHLSVWVLGALLLLYSNYCLAQNQFENPILPGGYPDPSICRVGDTFYMVNSSFEYFPGLPIHKSKDLVNWELVGHGLHRPSQCSSDVNLVDVQSDGGIHAPSIRYHKGWFYIITTNVYHHPQTKTTDFVNFILKSKSPEGPWSDPIIIEGAPGIDPDLFFDNDGRVWYVGNQMPENPNFQGEGEIWLQELNPENWSLIGERHLLWRGACGGLWAEGPHLYKRNGVYYLLIAEGGTSFNHAVMIAASSSITGPYESNDRNPVLTTRHLSYDNWVHSVGHADLFALDDGRWFMVALGVRGDINRGSNMGRETHLVPVQWEKEPFDWKTPRFEWPVIQTTTGTIQKFNDIPFENRLQSPTPDFKEGFDVTSLNNSWNFRRVPSTNGYSLISNPGFLRLFCNKTAFKKRTSYNFLGIKQTQSVFKFEADMWFDPKNKSSEAGIAWVQKDNYYLTFSVSSSNKGLQLELKVKSPDQQDVTTIASKYLEGYQGKIQFKIEANKDEYTFFYKTNQTHFQEFTKTPAHILISKGYTGAHLGPFSSGLHSMSKDFADFDNILLSVTP